MNLLLTLTLPITILCVGLAFKSHIMQKGLILAGALFILDMTMGWLSATSASWAFQFYVIAVAVVFAPIALVKAVSSLFRKTANG